MLGDQLALGVEQFQHRIDIREPELGGQRRHDHGLPRAQLEPVLVLGFLRAQHGVAGGACGSRDDLSAIGFGHGGHFEADPVGDAGGRAHPHAPQALPRISWHGKPRSDPIRVALHDLAFHASPFELIGTHRNRVRKCQSVVLGTPDGSEPDSIDTLERSPAQRDRHFHPHPRSQGMGRFHDRQLADSQHVPAVAIAVDPLRSAVLVQLQKVTAGMLEHVF